jgi:hypothetical protein
LQIAWQVIRNVWFADGDPSFLKGKLNNKWANSTVVATLSGAGKLFAGGGLGVLVLRAGVLAKWKLWLMGGAGLGVIEGCRWHAFWTEPDEDAFRLMFGQALEAACPDEERRAALNTLASLTAEEKLAFIGSFVNQAESPFDWLLPTTLLDKGGLEELVAGVLCVWTANGLFSASKVALFGTNASRRLAAVATGLGLGAPLVSKAWGMWRNPPWFFASVWAQLESIPIVDILEPESEPNDDDESKTDQIGASENPVGSSGDPEETS